MRSILGFCALLAGCAVVPPAPSTGRAAALDGTLWAMAEVDAGRPVTLEFRARDGGGLTVGGYDGCNRFNGPADLGVGEAIRFERLVVTRMACPEPQAAIERRVQAALGEARSMRVEGPALTLMDATGASLAQFRRQ